MTDSFTMYAGPDPDAEQLDYLIAHEAFHAWNGGKIKVAEPEALMYWFKEGFTDYYAFIVLLRAGGIDPPTYVRSYNEMLAAYFDSAEKTSPNRRVAEAFFTDRAVEKLPYQRGRVLAHAWNAEIRAEHPAASLDDLMRAVRAATEHGRVLDSKLLDQIARQFLRTGTLVDTERYVDAGALLEPKPDALGPCVRYLPAARRDVFERGFDRAASERARVIIGLVAGSRAARAGVHDGDALVMLEASNDPARATELVVQRDGVERHFSYLPTRTVTQPMYELDTALLAADATRCMRIFRAP